MFVSLHHLCITILMADGLFYLCFGVVLGDQERAIQLLPEKAFANYCCIVRIIFITRTVAKDKYI